ncbi:MAG: WG repeat-containing protein [Cytophagales bacterium]|nr:WG repeat-containing protein [Bernardetiaceae bacterium]MDW8210894.1 WG repeat-containing protein [Cytophagales bacterium]
MHTITTGRYFLPLLLAGLLWMPTLAQRRPMPKDAGTLPPGVSRPPANNTSTKSNTLLLPEIKKPVDSATIPQPPTQPVLEKIDSAYIAALGKQLFVVRQQNLVGIANDTGKIILSPVYDHISFLNNKDSTCSRWEGILKVRKGGTVGLIHYHGKPITTFDYQEVSLFPASCQSTAMVAKVKQFDKFGLITIKGEILIRPSYDDIAMLTDEQGKATTPTVIVVRRQSKYGMMELQSGFILKTEFERIEFLQYKQPENKNKAAEKELLLRFKQNGKWGFLNLASKWQSNAEWDDLQPFSDGWAPVLKSNKWGFINQEGKNKIACQYETTLGFRQGGAPVRKNGKWFLINTNGKIISSSWEDMQFLLSSQAEKYHNAYHLSLIKVKQNDKWGLLDTKGHVIIPCQYDQLEWMPRAAGFKSSKEGKEEFIALPEAPPTK